MRKFGFLRRSHLGDQVGRRSDFRDTKAPVRAAPRRSTVRTWTEAVPFHVPASIVHQIREMTSEAMMRDDARLEQMRATLAVDGYHLSVDEVGSGFDVRITADSESCADCLVPEQVMVSMLQSVLGADQAAIRLSYPGDADGEPAPDLSERGA